MLGPQWGKATTRSHSRLEAAQLVGQPGRDPAPQVAVGDPGRVPIGRELARMVGDGHQPQPQAPGLDDRAAPRLGLAATGPGDGDAGLAEQLERLDQRLGLVVERVVVGQADRADRRSPGATARLGAARGRRTAFHGRAPSAHRATRCSTRGCRAPGRRSGKARAPRGPRPPPAAPRRAASPTARPSITSPSSAIVGVTRAGYPPCTASPPCSSSVLPIGGIGLSRMIRAMCRRLCAHHELVRCVYACSGPPASR